MACFGKDCRAGIALALALCSLIACTGTVRADAPPPDMADLIDSIISQPRYAHSTWGIRLVDLAGGETLIDRNGEKMFVPGSILKVYSTATALDGYGADYRFRTPVFASGKISRGALSGHLVLVASGDFSFGLRERPDGTLGFNSLPELDHNYADTGFPGATLLKDSHPLAALDDLARQVRRAGIREVRGNVVIDDRLFDTYRDWPDGPIPPIWINENLIDITTTPTRPNRPARVDWRPKTAALRVESGVVTRADGDTAIRVDSPRPGLVRVRGVVRAGAGPKLDIWPIPDPAAFARTAFIEALRRAGVRVDAPSGGSNPAGLLPRNRASSGRKKVAEHVSPPLSEFVKVVLKTSYNRGADLMLCLAAVRSGSRDCAAGLRRELDLITRLGVSKDSTVLFDGAGSDERERTSPADQAAFLRAIAGQPWGVHIRQGLSVLGVDGTQAINGVGTPAAGFIRVKDGSRAAMTPGDLQGILTAKTQVGYIEGKTGRQLVYAVFLRDMSMLSFEDFRAADRDVAAVAEVIQQGY